MKKLVLLLFILFSTLTFASSEVSWMVEKYGEEIVVRADITGDILSFLRVEVEPFSDNYYSTQGKDLDITNELTLKVEKEYFSSDDTAYYTCVIEDNDYNELVTYKFKIQKHVILEILPY